MEIHLQRIPIRRLHKKLQTRKILQSINFLLKNRNIIAQFNDFEDFIWHIINHQTNTLSGFEYHFGQIRLELARKLWSEEIFIGLSVVESLLFSILKDSNISDPIQEFLERIRDYGLHRAGFIIYPIHSFGIRGFGLFRFLTNTQAYFISEDSGIAVTPQANSQDKLYTLLNQITVDMGIKHKISTDILNHYINSRPLHWLVYNPLLIVRARVFSGGYYENQFLLLIKLKLSKALILMLSSLGKASGAIDTSSKMFSSSQINNFQTLDIKHYLVFQSPVGNKRYLNIDCVPMNINKPELSELSLLNVDLDPREWKRRQKTFSLVKNALINIERGYIENCVSAKRETVKSRVYRKIFDSLKYFERSFRESSGIEDNVVNLWIAFEVLLADDSERGGAKKRIISRLKLALRGVKGTQKLQQSVSDLYECRNAIVHSGKTDGIANLQNCRKAFVYALISLVNRLENLPNSSGNPIQDLFNINY